jgi:hypothetical protein
MLGDIDDSGCASCGVDGFGEDASGFVSCSDLGSSVLGESHENFPADVRGCAYEGKEEVEMK